MKILSIDTSSKFLSIALAENEAIIREGSHLLDRKHSSELIPKISQLLNEAGFSIKEIDVFIVGLGPGSFTGLRIGVSVVKGFGLTLKKPCIGVASIDALALEVAHTEALIVPIIDAKRENVYSAVYRKKGDRVIRLSGYQLIKIDKLMKRIYPPAANNNSVAIFLGDGIKLYKEKIEHVNKKAIFLNESYWYPKAGNLIKWAIKEKKIYNKGSLSKLKPMYLYPKDCQVKKG